jgi:hypothetical protein
MQRVWCLSPLLLSACAAIAFTPGLKPTPPPTKFLDIDNSPSREEQKEEGITSTSSRTFGMSLVVGGKTMDAGALPPPPVPVVILP